MDIIRKTIQVEADLLIGNVNRMCVTDDRAELDNMYEWANKRLAILFAHNSARLDAEQKSKEATV